MPTRECRAKPPVQIAQAVQPSVFGNLVFSLVGDP
jgi:hypothetical protein